MDKTILTPESLFSGVSTFVSEHLQVGAAHIDAIKQTNGTSAKDALPNLTIDHTPQTRTKTPGALGVIEDLGIGAYKELTQHTGRVLENAAIGIGVGALATVLAPEIAIAAGAIGLAVGGYELATHAGGWIHDAKVVADPNGHTKAEIARAHADMQGLGGGGVNLAAGMAGGLLGARLAGLGETAVAAADAPKTAVAPASETVPEPTMAKAPTAPEAHPTSEAPAPPEAATPSDAPSAPKDAGDAPSTEIERRFKIVGRDYEEETAKVAQNRGGKLIVREIDSDGNLGDELKVWLQHHGPVEGADGAFMPMLPTAAKADLIISCFPELIDDAALLAKHVFPNGNGVITTALDASDPSIMVVKPDPGYQMAKAIWDSIAKSIADFDAQDAAEAQAKSGSLDEIAGDDRV